MIIYVFHRTDQTNKKGEAPICAYVVIDGKKSGNFALGLVCTPEALGSSVVQGQIELAKRAIEDIHTFLSLSQKAVSANDVKTEYVKRKRGNRVKVVEVNKYTAPVQRQEQEDYCFFEVARMMGKPHYYIVLFEKYAKQHSEFSTKISAIKPLVINYLSQFLTKNKGTAKVYFHRIKQVILYAIEEDLVRKNPLRSMIIKPKKREQLTYLTDIHIQQILDYQFPAKLQPYADMFLFACYTGLSLSDCAVIKQANIVAYGERQYIVARRKKSSSIIRTELPEKAHALWQKYNYDFSQYIGATRGTNEYNRQYGKVLRVITLAQKITGVHVTFHKARHTKAFELLNRGATIDTVSATLGHTNVAVTQQYYAELSLDSLSKALDKLDK